ncbi:FmdB family zinc ribbon protein [Burkholderia pseudomallei]|uniref:FmdB family zinc ribbon protein n=1 Tax=Burkholderia pseudomallei TaxID=28450 RepID=UPI001326B460|nr:FmdB family zinc ribbon protein [Burkholderia pseudomallei]MWA20807.1 zinc ribbon domain-containing protein [Burkholderia pseudomallei]
MPIYAYRCEACGYAKDVLQKMSDAPLSQCPECGQDAFRKQVTAAGFQLKGSGWYVTDFRGGWSGSSGPAEGGGMGWGERAGGVVVAAPAAADSTASAPAASTPAPAAAPASST